MPGATTDTLLFSASLIGDLRDAAGSSVMFTRTGAPATPTLETGFRIWAVSDIHIKASDGTVDRPIEKFRRAIADANGLGCDLAMLNGDLTNEGYANEYARLAECLSLLDIPYEATTGNHEFLGTDGETVHKQRFMDFFGYSGNLFGHHIHNGIMLVRVCTEKANANMGWIRSPQLTWLTNLLAANRDKSTILFMHHPLRGTVVKSDLTPNYTEQTAQIRSILSANPQVKVVMTGHSHQSLVDSPQWMTDASGVQLAGGASTAYRREYTAANTWETSIKRYDMEESPFLEVSAGGIVLKGRRHLPGAEGWISEHSLAAPTTYRAPVQIAPSGEVLRYYVFVPPVFSIAGKYIPRFSSTSGRAAKATLFSVEDCAGGGRAFEYLPDERAFSFVNGGLSLKLPGQQFCARQPIYFAAVHGRYSQRLWLRVGDRGAVQTAARGDVAGLPVMPGLNVGNTPDGRNGMDGWCCLRLWGAELGEGDVVGQWAEMGEL